MSFGKLLVVVAATIIGSIIALKIIGALFSFAIHAAFNIIVPLALVVGVVYVICRLTDRKAIGSRRDGTLP